MTLGEARKILGLGPDDDPRPCMRELLAERENLATTVRDAANNAFAMRHQERLVRFDQALATIRETLEALGLALLGRTRAQRGRSPFTGQMPTSIK